MNTGEDIQGLRKITDFTRLLSTAILVIHFYLSCYQVFWELGFTAGITDKLIANIAKTGLFNNLWKPKLAALLTLTISILAVKGAKNEKVTWKQAVTNLIMGLLIYLLSFLCFYLPLQPMAIAGLYMSATAIGYLLILTGGGLLSRIIKASLATDVFNQDNETFPQEERLLENEYSVNLPTRYNLKGKIRNAYINIINPFRGLLVSGTPGSW